MLRYRLQPAAGTHRDTLVLRGSGFRRFFRRCPPSGPAISDMALRLPTRLRRYSRTAILLFLVLAALHASPGPASLIDKPAPAFVRTDLDNRRIDLAALRGRVVLLNFWATWCAPCQIEMPRFVQWQSKYKSGGLEILGVSMDDDVDPVRALVRKRGINYPILMGDEKLGILYGGVLGLPVTYLIDRQGVIRAQFKGQTSLSAMEASIRRILDRP